jgi:soluble cytochrome b562
LDQRKKGEAKSSSDLKDLRSKLDVIIKEIEQIKRENEK